MNGIYINKITQGSIGIQEGRNSWISWDINMGLNRDLIRLGTEWFLKRISWILGDLNRDLNGDYPSSPNKPSNPIIL